MAKTADRLLDGVKRRAIVPSSQPLLDDDDILLLADDVTETLLVPSIKSVRQDYFVTSDRIDIVSGTASYAIPYRAIGRTLRDLKLVSSSGTRDLALVALEDEHLYPSGNIPHSFYFKGDKIILVPEPSVDDLELERWYELRPSRLVTVDAAAVVTTVGATTVTVSTAPNTITSGTVVDFVQAQSGNATLAMDVTCTNVSGTTYTFASGDIPDDLAVGDYVTVAETTPVVQLPPEAYPLLETAVTKRVMNALGDFEAGKVLGEDETEEVKRLKLLLEPRVTGEATVIINRRSLLRGSRARYRRGLIY